MARQINRVQTRADFNQIVDELVRSGAIERVRQIILFGEHKTPWEQAAALLDEMKKQMNFAREQVLLEAITLAFFLLGQGKLDKEAAFRDFLEKHEEEAN